MVITDFSSEIIPESMKEKNPPCIAVMKRQIMTSVGEDVKK